MQTRLLGNLKVSVVGIGCNNFGGRIDEARTGEVVSAALDAGITLFDTADIYGGTLSEEYLGRALGKRRDEAVVATKFGGRIDDERPGGASPDYIRRAVEDSLRRLGTDHIDLYQLHFPDAGTPIGDTLATLNELIDAGKVREIGCSNFSVEQLREAQAAVGEAAHGFASVQNEYSILQREPERGVLEECRRQGLGFLPYFPLANGMLTGKYRRGEAPPAGTRLGGNAERAGKLLTDERFETIERLERLAADHGHSILDLAFSWLLSRPQVSSVIAGATRAEQVRANAAAAEWELTDDVVAAVDQIAPLA